MTKDEHLEELIEQVQKLREDFDRFDAHTPAPWEIKKALKDLDLIQDRIDTLNGKIEKLVSAVESKPKPSSIPDKNSWMGWYCAGW